MVKCLVWVGGPNGENPDTKYTDTAFVFWLHSGLASLACDLWGHWRPELRRAPHSVQWSAITISKFFMIFNMGPHIFIWHLALQIAQPVLTSLMPVWSQQVILFLLTYIFLICKVILTILSSQGWAQGWRANEICSPEWAINKDNFLPFLKVLFFPLSSETDLSTQPPPPQKSIPLNARNNVSR